MGLDWTFPLLHSFDSPANPFATLTMDDAGNLYGTTNGRSYFATRKYLQTYARGRLLDLHLVVRVYRRQRRKLPSGNVARDAAGNLYGTTESGGAETGQSPFPHGCGVVWQMLCRAARFASLA